MKVAWHSVPLAPASAEPGTPFRTTRSLDRCDDLSGKTTRPHPVRMNYRCTCGMHYVVIPKEIPLAKDEALICHDCGCELKGRWSSRYFDYEPCRALPEEETRNRC